ncbi:glycosyltransferase family 2 protein [Chloroflexota bacterium]
MHTNHLDTDESSALLAPERYGDGLAWQLRWFAEVPLRMEEMSTAGGQHTEYNAWDQSRPPEEVNNEVIDRYGSTTFRDTERMSPASTGAKAPSFSVILATHNRAHLLGRAVDSVLTQTFHDFELIIVDDASPDSSRQVVESFSDDRIVYIRREQNGGASAARNTGICGASGQYIAFLDDDDEYLPDLLAQMSKVLESAPARIGFVGCGIQVMETSTSGGSTMRDQLPPTPAFNGREEAYLACLRHLPFGTGWGLTIRATCFDTVGLFDETLETDVDRDLIIRLVQQYDYAVIPQVLVRVHRHTGPKVSTYGLAKARAHERIIQKNVQALRQHPRLWAIWHYKTGWLHYHSGNRTRGRDFMLRGLRRHPWHLKSWFGLFVFEVFRSRGPNLHQTLSRVKGTACRKH